MTETNDLPRSQNQGWGFYGTMQDHAQAAWPLAMLAIRDATGESLDDVRAFLDSTHGRHFADDVHNSLSLGVELPKAIDAAVARWMRWTVGLAAAKRHDIPRGLPYLSAMVIHEGMAATMPD